MPGLPRRLGFSSTQAAMAEALILGRMAEPMSEHAFHRHIPLTALPDILGDRLLNISLDTFYRVGDRLLDAKDEIERHLRETTELKLGLTRSILLYDLTNFHFEGGCEGNPKAVRGKNKQKRDDCPQVIAGVVFDEYGFELLHKTFPGNKSDSKSFPDIIGELDAATRSIEDLPFDRPTVIMDAGISSEENVKSIIARQLHYIVHDRRPLRGKHADLFAEKGFEEIPGRPPDEAVMARLVDVPKDERSHPDVPEKILLCKSCGRQAKEKAITSKAEERILKDLEKLSKRIGKGRIKDRPTLDQAVGRLKERHSRVARFYKIETDGPDVPKPDALNSDTAAETPKELDTPKADDAKIDAPKTDTPKTDDAKADGKPKLKISWSRISDKFEAEAALQGCYALRTDRDDLNAHALFSYLSTFAVGGEPKPPFPLRGPSRASAGCAQTSIRPRTGSTPTSFKSYWPIKWCGSRCTSSKPPAMTGCGRQSEESSPLIAMRQSICHWRMDPASTSGVQASRRSASATSIGSSASTPWTPCP